MNIPLQAQALKKYFENAFEDVRKKYNLTNHEVIILLYLEKNISKDTAKDIQEEIMAVKSHISKSVDSLVEKGIIIRVPDEEDKKMNHLKIVDINSNLVRDIRDREMEINNEIFDGISKEEIEVIEKSLIKIIVNIKKIVKK